jgi:hypothetical protein
VLYSGKNTRLSLILEAKALAVKSGVPNDNVRPHPCPKCLPKWNTLAYLVKELMKSAKKFYNIWPNFEGRTRWKI